MYEWYVGPPGADKIEFVGRTETLETDFAIMLRAYQAQVPPKEWQTLFTTPRLNQSVINDDAPEESKIEWTDDMLQELRRLEYPTYKRFYGG